VEKLLKTYKFKLIPDYNQEKKLYNYLNTTRFIYNLCLEYKKTLYISHKKSISKYDIQKELKDIKNETPWIKELHSQVVQDVTDRLFITYDNFFRKFKNKEKVSYPKFAKKDFWSSFKFKQGVGLCVNTNKIKLPKIGKIKYKKSKEIRGNIKNAIIKKEYDGWYICLCCEINNPNKLSFNHKIDETIGIDLGVKDLIITSDGEVKENIKTLNKWSIKLAKIQKELSRKEKGSNNRKKTKNKLRKIYSKISRIRKDYLHKITTEIINNNQVIICEDLNVKGMVKNHKLAKSISDASWDMLCNMLEYKSKWNGKIFHKVSPHYTSQDCSNCRHRNSELKLSDREWICETCQTHHDRDVNAANNIKIKGIYKLKEVGHTFSTFGDMEGVIRPAEEPLKLLI